MAVDGKTLGGTQAKGGDGRPVHLLAAMDHTSRAVLAQRQVSGAPEEVPAFQPLMDGLDLAGTVITADALHTHPQAAEFLVTRKQAHYLTSSAPDAASDPWSLHSSDTQSRELLRRPRSELTPVRDKGVKPAP